MLLHHLYKGKPEIDNAWIKNHTNYASKKKKKIDAKRKIGMERIVRTSHVADQSTQRL